MDTGVECRNVCVVVISGVFSRLMGFSFDGCGASLPEEMGDRIRLRDAQGRVA